MVDLYPLNQTFIYAHLAVYLNWRRYSTAKGAKKNTSPNVICLQYLTLSNGCERHAQTPRENSKRLSCVKVLECSQWSLALSKIEIVENCDVFILL